jgi:hypothetical protein
MAAIPNTNINFKDEKRLLAFMKTPLQELWIRLECQLEQNAMQRRLTTGNSQIRPWQRAGEIVC